MAAILSRTVLGWLQLSVYANKILEQNCSHNEWTLGMAVVNVLFSLTAENVFKSFCGLYGIFLRRFLKVMQIEF